MKVVLATAVVLAAFARADWNVMEWSDNGLSSRPPPCRLECFPALVISLSRAAFCFTLYFLWEFSADPVERLPLPVQHGESYSLLDCQFVEIS